MFRAWGCVVFPKPYVNPKPLVCGSGLKSLGVGGLESRVWEVSVQGKHF